MLSLLNFHVSSSCMLIEQGPYKHYTESQIVLYTVIYNFINRFLVFIVLSDITVDNCQASVKTWNNSLAIKFCLFSFIRRRKFVRFFSSQIRIRLFYRVPYSAGFIVSY